MHGKNESLALMRQYKKFKFSDFHTLYVLCAYNTMLLVMGEISKDGIEFKNYIFRFSSEEIIKFWNWLIFVAHNYWWNLDQTFQSGLEAGPTTYFSAMQSNNKDKCCYVPGVYHSKKLNAKNNSHNSSSAFAKSKRSHRSWKKKKIKASDLLRQHQRHRRLFPSKIFWLSIVLTSEFNLIMFMEDN